MTNPPKCFSLSSGERAELLFTVYGELDGSRRCGVLIVNLGLKISEVHEKTDSWNVAIRVVGPFSKPP